MMSSEDTTQGVIIRARVGSRLSPVYIEQSHHCHDDDAKC